MVGTFGGMLKLAIVYLYLSLVYLLGGMDSLHPDFLNVDNTMLGIPIQSTTDCGSETIRVFALASALRSDKKLGSLIVILTILCSEIFSDLSLDELPAHRFLRSIHNITIERGWFRLRLQWGDNIKVFYHAGVHVYNSSDPN